MHRFRRRTYKRGSHTGADLIHVWMAPEGQEILTVDILHSVLMHS